MIRLFYKFRSKISLLNFFTLTTLLTAIIIFAIYLGMYKTVVSDSISNIFYQNTSNTSSYLEDRINAEFSSLRSVFLTVSDSLELLDVNDQETVDRLFETTNDYIRHDFAYEVLDQNKQIIYNYPNNDFLLGIDKSNIDYFKVSMEDGDYQWVKPQLQSYFDESTIALLIKTLDGYLEIFIPVAFIDDFYHQLFEETGTVDFLITNQYGIIIYDSGSTSEDISDELTGFKELSNIIDDTSNIHYFEVNGVNSIVSARSIDAYDWYMFTYEPASVTQNLINSLRNSFTLLLFVIFIVFVSTVFIIFGFVRAQLTKFQKSFDMVSTGDLDVSVDEDNFIEIHKMTASLNQMVSNIRTSRQELEEYIYVDRLTGFFTRNYLLNVYKSALQTKKMKNMTVVYFDIRRFGVINESYGFSFGDKVLQAFSERLQSSFLDIHHIFRYESDEFIMILENLNKEESREIILQVTELFQQVLIVDDIIIKLSFRFGITEMQEHHEELEDAINHCKMALNIAKKDQFSEMIFYEDLDNVRLERQLQIELLLDDALDKKEFQIVFQPIVNRTNHKIRGFEVLSRWESKTLGTVYPDEFIPLLEKSFRIIKLDTHVISESIKMTKSLSKKFGRNFVLSCNVSVESLLNSSFVGFIIDTLQKFQYEGRYLELEITESTIISDFVAVKKTMRTLSEYGVKFSEDDFGDGFSSLNYLTELDLDTLKISKSLVDRIGDSFNNTTLFNSIITLANDLGLDTIIEGVENLETYQIIQKSKSSFIQGYYFYKPMSFLALVDVLEQQSKENLL